MESKKDQSVPTGQLQGMPPAPWIKLLTRPGNVIHLRQDLNWRELTITPLHNLSNIQARPMVVD